VDANPPSSVTTSLRADHEPEEVGTVRVERLPAELDHLAVGQHERQPRHVVHGEAVLRAVRASGVLGDVAPDRADLLAGRVGRVEEAVRRDRSRDVQVRHPRLDDDALRVEVDLKDPRHPRERDHDAAGDGSRAAGEPRSGAARDERDLVSRTGADDRLHLLGRARQRYELGDRAVPGQAVALVDAQLLRLREDVLRAHDAAKLGREGTRERHRGESSEARSPRS
jgi:hypothetical protein